MLHEQIVKTFISCFSGTNPTTDELLFGIPKPSSVLLKKRNYTLLFYTVHSTLFREVVEDDG